MSTCPYCSVPEEKAWAINEAAMAIQAPQSITEGHVVIAPLRHVPAFYDLDVGEQSSLWALVSEVRRHLSAALKSPEVAVGFEDGFGLEGHTHIHMVPLAPGLQLPAHIEWVKET